MSERKSNGPLYGIGGVTLLTVLLILCLTLFAVLALSSAQADRRLSEKNAAAVTAYYDTENSALELLAQIEGMWASGQRKPAASEVAAKLTVSYDVQVLDEGAGLRIDVNMPMLETQTLQIEAYLGPGGRNSRWEVRKWQLLPPVQNEGDEAKLPLFVPN